LRELGIIVEGNGQLKRKQSSPRREREIEVMKQEEGRLYYVTCLLETKHRGREARPRIEMSGVRGNGTGRQKGKRQFEILKRMEDQAGRQWKPKKRPAKNNRTARNSEKIIRGRD